MQADRFLSFIAANQGLWDAYLGHAWMEAIHDGSLSRERFAFFLAQDMPYQTDFLRALVLGAAASPEPDVWLDLRTFIAAEAAFEAGILEEMGTPCSFGRWDALPAREGYMNHLTRVALEGNDALIAASLLPCAAGFTGAMATPTTTPPADPLYARWLAFYERPEQTVFSDKLVGVFERAIARATADDVATAGMIFRRSLQHQIAVFDAAWALSDPWRDG